MTAKKTSDLVFDVIEEKIRTKEWTPGMKIYSELKLAKEIGVSRMSVREAIEKLVALGILTKRQGEGNYVNDLDGSLLFNTLIPMITLDADNYLEILEYRLIMEVGTIENCVKNADLELIKNLEESYNTMLENKDNIEVFTEEDLNFHSLIAQGGGNSFIIKVNSILKNALLYHQKQLYKTLGPSGGLKEHKFILDAIKSRDIELSKLYIKRHIQRTIEDIKSI